MDDTFHTALSLMASLDVRELPVAGRLFRHECPHVCLKSGRSGHLFSGPLGRRSVSFVRTCAAGRGDVV